MEVDGIAGVLKGEGLRLLQAQQENKADDCAQSNYGRSDAEADIKTTHLACGRHCRTRTGGHSRRTCWTRNG
jgi:hypothetical protein